MDEQFQVRTIPHDPAQNHSTRRIERRLGDWMRTRLPHRLAEFIMLGLKQAWACLFGGLMLIGLIVTDAIWQPDWPIARYDALLIYAIALQGAFLWLKLETWREVRVIALFHLTGTWIYAGQSGFDWVSLSKLGSWYLLLYVSFATVTLIYRDALSARPITTTRATPEP